MFSKKVSCHPDNALIFPLIYLNLIPYVRLGILNTLQIHVNFILITSAKKVIYFTLIY